MEQHNESMNHGRPTKLTQAQTQKEIRECFEQGLSASTAAQKIGLNVKTTCKYYDEWCEQIQEQETVDFLKRHKKNRSQMITALDKLIIQAYDFQTEIEDEVKSCKKATTAIPKHLFDLRFSLMKHVTELVEKKGLFLLQPTIDEDSRQEIVELIRKYDESQRSN